MRDNVHVVTHRYTQNIEVRISSLCEDSFYDAVLTHWSCRTTTAGYGDTALELSIDGK